MTVICEEEIKSLGGGLHIDMTEKLLSLSVCRQLQFCSLTVSASPALTKKKSDQSPPFMFHWVFRSAFPSFSTSHQMHLAHLFHIPPVSVTDTSRYVPHSRCLLDISECSACRFVLEQQTCVLQMTNRKYLFLSGCSFIAQNISWNSKKDQLCLSCFSNVGQGFSNPPKNVSRHQ